MKKPLSEKLDFMKEHMIERLDRSDDALIYILKGFAFDECSLVQTWNAAVAKADLESDRIFYKLIGYIGFPVGEHIHKYFDCPVKAEKAWDDANKASDNAYFSVLKNEFYDLIDGGLIPAPLNSIVN